MSSTQLAAGTKILLVTGGSRGLGKNTVLALAKRGVFVVFTYHSNKAAADDVLAEVRSLGPGAIALQLDVAKPETIPAFVESFVAALKSVGREKFDYLINNAGTAHFASVAETKASDIDEIFTIHFKSVFLLTQALLPHINDGGKILNTSTGLARFILPGGALYASIKSAIETFTRYLAKELGPRKITVNVVAPGVIATDFGGGSVRDTPQVRETLGGTIALGRVGEPEDIGKAYAAILSDDLSWVNGQRIEVSGGQNL